MTLIEQIGLVASVSLPLWNIPLIRNIIKRKSSADISLMWVLGVWGCSLFMLPAGIISEDIVLKMFSIVNIVLFTGVVIVVLKYRKK